MAVFRIDKDPNQTVVRPLVIGRMIDESLSPTKATSGYLHWYLSMIETADLVTASLHCVVESAARHAVDDHSLHFACESVRQPFEQV